MFYWEKQKKIKALYDLYARPVRMKHDLTPMAYSVLMFLHRNPAHDTAASIVQISQFAKSQVSAAIKDLEKRELITKEYLGNNNKTIHLRLTEQAEEILQEAEHAEKQYTGCLFAGFSEEELLQIKQVFARICDNAETELQNQEEREKDA